MSKKNYFQHIAQLYAGHRIIDNSPYLLLVQEALAPEAGVCRPVGWVMAVVEGRAPALACVHLLEVSC